VVCLQEAGELGSQQVAGLTDRYAVFTAKRETALLLRKGFEGLVGSVLPESDWRVPLEAAGKEMAFDLKVDWEANLDKTCVVLTQWNEQPAVIVATHLKPSDATPPFVVALRRVLESFPLVLIGMDANTPAGMQKGFGRLLKDNWLHHTAKPSTELTVRKQRTSFQSQLNKLSLDAAMKDWIVVFRHDWSVDVGPTVNTPALQRDSLLLLPTSLWPFDHAMVSTHLLKRSTAVPRIALGTAKESGLVTPTSSRSSSPESTRRSARSTARSSITSTRLYTLLDTWRRSPREALRQATNYLQITLITGAMGALEIEDRALLGLFASSVTVIVALGIYVVNANTNLVAAFGGSFGFAVGAILLILLLRNLVVKIEGLDRYAWQFDKARQKLLGGVATDERGPPSFKPSRPLRHDSPDLEANLKRAEELLPSFKQDILDGLARAAGGDQLREIKFNVKQMARCEEKARKDYGGDGARVTDLLRGCVILNDDIVEVRAAYSYLEGLKESGSIDILQNKNRYIDGPTMCLRWGSNPTLD
jgi:hypothetical protein